MAPSLVWRTPCQEAITRNQFTAVSLQAKYVGYNVQTSVFCLHVISSGSNVESVDLVPSFTLPLVVIYCCQLLLLSFTFTAANE